MASMVRFSIGDHSDRVPFGIRKIDRACRGGMKRGAMYLLGAETGGGKTTFLQGVAVETAKKGTVLLVSPEMDIDELAEREIMRQSGYSIFDIGPWVRPDQKVAAEKALKEAADRIIRENMNVEIMEDIEATMSEIAIEAKKIKNLRLVIIDYAQEIADMDSKLARYLAVGEVGKDAIKLGRACNCPVLIASQVNKTKTTGGRTEYEFRESKKLSHKANTTMIISLKNRGGPRFTVDLDYKPSIYRMTNLDVKNIEHQDNWQDTGDY
jgi:replicative DNA helicase